MRIPIRATAAALCLTPACVDIASQFSKNLSPNYQTLDPCTDFEELVCGGWRANHQLRPDQGGKNTFAVMAEEVEYKVRDIMQGPYPGHSSHSHFSPRNLDPPQVSLDEQNFNTMQRAFNACMDATTIQELGLGPITTLLDELDETFDPSAENWADTGKFLELIGIRWLVDINVAPSPRDPEKVMVFIAPEKAVGLSSKSYYKDTETVSQYRDAVAHIFHRVHPTGVDAEAAAENVTEWAAAVVDFEVKLAALVPEISELKGPGMHHYYSIDDADNLAPQLGLAGLLRALVPADYNLKNHRVMITDAPFFINLAALLLDTPRSTLERYFEWKVMQSKWQLVIDEETFAPYRGLLNRLDGKEPDAVPERWRKCVGHVENGLGWIVSRFFVETSFSAEDRDLGNDIIAELRQKYIDNFANIDWMDDEVKQAAVEKVQAIEQRIGYPSTSPNITDPAALQKHYSKLTITTSFANNSLAVSRRSAHHRWRKLSRPVNRREWHMYAHVVNAYYSPALNQIAFPAGIMQPPLFGKDFPSYINYGGFGTVAGHEVSHGFDDSGRRFDSHGRNVDWWTDATKAEYNKRTDCFVEQFDGFTLIGADGQPIAVKGNQTLGENIADSAGISVAFKAWQDRYYKDKDRGNVDKNLKEKEGLLPGLEHYFKTPEQLFFLAFANGWCSKNTPAKITHQILVDVHSPAPVRIKGSLENSRGFREAFGCPVKEPTCELW